MAVGLIDKITNVFMTEDDEYKEYIEEVKPKAPERDLYKPVLTLHKNNFDLKVAVFYPKNFDQASIIANKLKAKQAVMINYDLVDDITQQRINDFINGVCYVLNGAVQVISDKIVLYVPEHTEIGKELYAYSIPTYVKNG